MGSSKEDSPKGSLGFALVANHTTLESLQPQIPDWVSSKLVENRNVLDTAAKPERCLYSKRKRRISATEVIAGWLEYVSYCNKRNRFSYHLEERLANHET
ncbi:hypothetical protein CHS0354_013330, partial [Potamilus streckersoni]